MVLPDEVTFVSALREMFLPYAIASVVCAGFENKSFFELMMLTCAYGRPERRIRYTDDRRHGMWQDHLAKCRHKGNFVRKYHMTEESFNRLVDDLGPYLCVDEVKSRNSTSGIQPVDKRFLFIVPQSCEQAYRCGDTKYQQCLLTSDARRTGDYYQ
jgi:hypothetical protein